MKTETLHTFLLCVVIVLLAVLLYKQSAHSESGRFQPLAEDSALSRATTHGVAVLDTKTGRVCTPFDYLRNENLPYCPDLR